MIAECALHRQCLRLVPESRGSRVSVDVLKVLWTELGIGQRVHHRQSGALTILRRSGDVMSVPAHPEADDLGVDARPAALRVLELFENDGTAAVAENETVAIQIPGTAGLLRRVVTRRERLCLAEAPEATSRHGHLAASGDDHVGVTVLDGAHSQADRMRGSRARGDDPQVRSLQTVLDGEVAGDHVDDAGRHEEGRNLARIVPGFQIGVVLPLDRAQATDTGAANRAAARGVHLAEVDAAIGDGLDAGRDTVVHELVHAPGFLRRYVLLYVEVLDLPPEADREG